MSDRTCTVNGCDSPHWAMGKCSKHYQRNRRTGMVDRLCPCGAPARSRTAKSVCDDCRFRNQRRKARESELRRCYGTTTIDYDRMLAAQFGVCAVCATDTPGRGHEHFSVDHDHSTGEVRGLLCFGCNVGLGHFGDDPARLRAAAAYLEEHR